MITDSEVLSGTADDSPRFKPWVTFDQRECGAIINPDAIARTDAMKIGKETKPVCKWIERFEEWLADSGFLKGR